MIYLDDMDYVLLREKCVDQMKCAACRCISENVPQADEIRRDRINAIFHEAARAAIVEGADIWPEYTRDSILIR